MTLRTIHIGVGNRGRWPIKTMSRDDRFAPVALVDINSEALKEARDQLGLSASACFSDADDAIRQVESDAVVICSPTSLHAEFCRAAFRQGKHVLVEKGMTYDWEEAKALVREAEEAGVKFCVAQSLRYFPTFITLAKILENTQHSDYPGKPQIVDFVQHRYRPDPKNLTFPFSMVWDLAVHHVDLLILLLGPIRRVRAHTYSARWSRYNHESNVTAFIEFCGGAVCNYLLTTDGRYNELRLVVQGERGAIRHARETGQPATELLFTPLPETGGARPCSILETCNPSEGVTNAFFDFLARDIEPGISGRNNLETMAACEMIRRSVLESRTVDRNEL